MTKTEIKILSKRITSLKSKYKEYWKDLQEQISELGYQGYYTCQESFVFPIKNLILSLEEYEKQSLINEWRSKKDRMQFENDEDYLKQYELYIMEEIIKKINKSLYDFWIGVGRNEIFRLKKY